MIYINHQLSIPESDLREDFVHASGPGGQNVNKVSTAVQLRFDISGNRSLPEPVKRRLYRLVGKSVTRNGELIIAASNHRNRERNRQEARNRLTALVRRAAQKPKPHIKTGVPRQSRLKRLEAKKKRSRLKQMRRQKNIDDT